MNLKRGVGPFQGNVVPRHLERVRTINAHLKRFMTQGAQGRGQGTIPRMVSQGRGLQIRFGQGRKNADRHHPSALSPR